MMCTSEAEAPDRLVLLEVALEAEGSASPKDDPKEGSGAGPSVAAPSARPAAAAGAGPRSRDATQEVRWLG